MRKRVTRREFGFAATATAAFAQSGPHTQSGGNQKPVENKTDTPALDPVHWTHDRYKSVPLRLTFQATTRAEAEAWQRQLRAKLTELLGGFPDRTPLQAETLEIREFPGYRREK